MFREMALLRHEYKVKTDSLMLRIDRNHEEMQSSITESTSEIKTQLSGLPDILKDKILSNFSVEGVLPLTNEDLQRAFSAMANSDSFKNVINACLDSRGLPTRGGPEALPESPAPPTASIPSSNESAEKYRIHSWPGKICKYVLPYEYKFPSLPAKAMYTLWYFGNDMELVPPLRILGVFYESLRTKKNKVSFSRLKAFISAMDKCMEELNVTQDLENMGFAQCDALFDQVFPTFLGKIYGNRSRHSNSSQVVLDTLINKYYKELKNERLNTNVNAIDIPVDEEMNDEENII